MCHVAQRPHQDHDEADHAHPVSTGHALWRSDQDQVVEQAEAADSQGDQCHQRLDVTLQRTRASPQQPAQLEDEPDNSDRRDELDLLVLPVGCDHRADGAASSHDHIADGGVNQVRGHGR